MARIRTIKPEFPHSESMGRVSREARLLFIQLWTISDDEGRLRGNSRILSSLLFPYDDDAKDLIDNWLVELEGEDCIVRYLIDGSTYLKIVHWRKHQRIDKPTPSKLPECDESSRILANPREASSGDRERKGLVREKDRDCTTVASQPCEPPEFSELKLIFPKRAGSQPWANALKAIDARLREGHSWAEILDGARRYAAYIHATGKERTEHVLQAATFCGPSKRFLEPFDLPISTAEQRKESNLEAFNDAEALLFGDEFLFGDECLFGDE
jgi:hypothetical protein